MTLHASKRSLIAMMIVFLIAALCLASRTSAVVDERNLLRNPTFEGADELIPPAGWEMYGSLANGHRMSVINQDDPETRALLIEDTLATRGHQGEIGLQQTVAGRPGRYRAIFRVGQFDGTDPFGPYLQLRFLPSHTLQQIRVTPGNTAGFEEYIVEADAPEDTTAIRVYLYTPDMHVQSVQVRSIVLVQID